MKKTLKSFVAFFCVMVITQSCSQSDEFLYSCNEEVDEWVVENLSDIKSMSWNDWLSIRENENRKAAYGAFSSNQKLAMWINRYHDILKLDWSDSEKEHIKKLLDYIQCHPYIFDGLELTPDQEDDMDLFLYRWKEQAVESFNWSDQVLYALLATGNKMIDKEGRLDINVAHRSTIIGGESGDRKDSCSCNIDDDWCGGQDNVSECVSDGCHASFILCGSWLAKSCNGNCYPYGKVS